MRGRGYADTRGLARHRPGEGDKVTRKRLPSSTAKARDARDARRAEAVALRRDGHDFADIGRAMGVSTSTAFRYVRDGLAAARERTVELGADLLALELAKLDRAEAPVMAKLGAMCALAARGDTDAIKAADLARLVSSLATLQGRRARLLGMDAAEAPERAKDTDTDADLVAMVLAEAAADDFALLSDAELIAIEQGLA